MLNILFAMMRAALYSRLICLGVVATLSFAIVRPAWAQDEEESASDYKDPTIVTDESTAVPDGVKDLSIKKPDKKPIDDPVYNKWWFWAGAVGAAGAWIFFALSPMHKMAPTCGGNTYTAGCVGDGRAP